LAGEAVLERLGWVGNHEGEGINPSPAKKTARTRLVAFVGARAARVLGRAPTGGSAAARRGA
jgi:hypothetical protein